LTAHQPSLVGFVIFLKVRVILESNQKNVTTVFRNAAANKALL
jgi:hypothetical protein